MGCNTGIRGVASEALISINPRRIVETFAAANPSATVAQSRSGPSRSIGATTNIRSISFVAYATSRPPFAPPHRTRDEHKQSGSLDRDRVQYFVQSKKLLPMAHAVASFSWDDDDPWQDERKSSTERINTYCVCVQRHLAFLSDDAEDGYFEPPRKIDAQEPSPSYS
jgi:hypothetical protein